MADMNGDGGMLEELKSLTSRSFAIMRTISEQMGIAFNPEGDSTIKPVYKCRYCDR
jgi:hypothetical protein